MRPLRFFLLFFVLVASVARALAEDAHVATASHGMVATVHPLATDAAVDVMKRGGNAVDAAVAAAVMLGVVDSQNSGIGGGCFIVMRLADGRIVAVDGREMAPALARRDMYLRDGKPVPELSQTGSLAVGTPGALAAYDYATRHFGKRKLGDLLLPAAEVAEGGFVVDQTFAARLAGTAKKLAKFDGARAIFMRPDGKTWHAGQRLTQPDLARTYRAIAEHGTPWFYDGQFAERVGQWMRGHGGILSAEDFKRYKVRIRKPVTSTYRGNQIVGFPPPSSGGVHVAQILSILENFDLKNAAPDVFVHIVAEAMKLAFADRAYWLGDADFANVPRGLIDKKYAKALAEQIDLDRSTKVAGHGTPPRAEQNLFERHTTHIAAADAEGNWVGITATINTSFGSGVVVPGTGVVLNNEMDDFSIAPGTPNAFGLVGAESNAIEPGKRPLSSMSPTIVLKDGQPVMTLGAAGGPTIITQVVLAIVNHIDRGVPIADVLNARAAPRFHHQWAPDHLLVESTLDDAIVSALRRRGHQIEGFPFDGRTQVIGVRDERRGFVGVADPRRPEGKAAGF